METVRQELFEMVIDQRKDMHMNAATQRQPRSQVTPIVASFDL